MFKNMLVANDGSEGAFRALARALDLARLQGARLHMIVVEEVSDLPELIDMFEAERGTPEARAEPIVEKSLALAALNQTNVEVHILIGHPVKRIVDFIDDHGIDLLVVGFFGHSALYERIIGGTAERLVRLAPCSVIVVK
jgi:nucleotide-binding universal stress UspA family protein